MRQKEPFLIYICDDDLVQLKAVVKYLEELPYKVKTFGHVAGLQEAMEAAPAHILLMDIRLDDGDGVEAVKALQKQNPACKVIYITGYPDQAERVFDTDPCHMLLKPVTQERVLAALNKALGQIKAEETQWVTVRTAGRLLRLDRGSIRYAESAAHKLRLHTTERDYECYGRLDDFQELLGPGFCRIHKSFLVNLAAVQAVEATGVILTEGKRIPVSRPHKEQIMAAFTAYLGGLL